MPEPPDPWNDFLKAITDAKPDSDPDPQMDAVLQLMKGMRDVSRVLAEGGRLRATVPRIEAMLRLEPQFQAWEIVDLGDCPDPERHEHLAYAVYLHPDPDDPAPAAVIRLTLMNGCLPDVVSTRTTIAGLRTMAQQFLELAAIAEAREAERHG